MKNFFKILFTALSFLLLLSWNGNGEIVLFNRKVRKEGAKYAKSEYYKSTLCDLCVSSLRPLRLMDFDFFNSPTLNSRLISEDTLGFMKLVRVDSFRLAILPPSSGVQFFKDKIVFLSMSKNERRMSANQISFGAVEAYTASFNDSITGKHEIFSPSFAFTSPAEAMTFSHDYNTIYYSKYSNKEKKEKIFSAEVTSDGLVIEKSPLDFCTGDYNYSHPALSSDDELLVFASDRDGSFGGMDLFFCRKSGGKWTTPENLGKWINTTGNEFFPFLDSDNNLYFASDGLKGYGGYDLFTCKFNGTGWDKPKNMGNRINTVNDDIALTINKTDGRTAFFTRRKSLKAYESQLYRVYLSKEADNLSLVTVFNGNPVLKTAQVASNAFALKTMVEYALLNREVKSSKATAVHKKTAIKNAGKKPPAKTTLPVKTEASKTTKPATTGQKEVVVYRVQIIPGASEKSSGEMVLNGASYKLYDYVYLGTKRYCIGEFNTLAPTVALQRICRQAGYAQAFVVAFKNNVRTLDPALFK